MLRISAYLGEDQCLPSRRKTVEEGLVLVGWARAAKGFALAWTWLVRGWNLLRQLRYEGCKCQRDSTCCEISFVLLNLGATY